MSAMATSGLPLSRNTASSRGDLLPGCIVYCLVQVNVALNNLARTVAEDHDIPITIPMPTRPMMRPRKRPCILLQHGSAGYLVLPLATFKKSDPDSWDLFLREVVVPIGAPSTILAAMRDRESFDTEPTWTHPEHAATYILPCAIPLPLGAPVELYDPKIPSEDLVRLQNYCDNLTEKLGALGEERIRCLLESYLELCGGVPQALVSPPGREEDRQTPGPRTLGSTLNPSAASFVSLIRTAPKPVDSLSARQIFGLVTQGLIAAHCSTDAPAPSNQVLPDNRASPEETADPPRKSERRAATAADVADKENRPP